MYIVMLGEVHDIHQGYGEVPEYETIEHPAFASFSDRDDAEESMIELDINGMRTWIPEMMFEAMIKDEEIVHRFEKKTRPGWIDEYTLRILDVLDQGKVDRYQPRIRKL